MAWTDFYMQSTGNDLNAGSTNADSAVYTSTGGNFDGTSVFTPTDGSTPSSLVNVNDWVSLYNTGDTVTRCVAQVTAVGAGVNGTITVSTTVKFGTVPTSNSGSRALKAGGAWASLAMTGSSAALNTGTAPLSTRINVKAGTYAGTSTSRTWGLAGSATVGLWVRGYKTSIGDQDTNNLAVAGTDIPSFTFTTGQLTFGSLHVTFSNIDITGAAVAGSGQCILNASGGILTFYGCRFTCTGANANSAAFTISSGGNVNLFLRCWFKATSSATQVVNNAGTYDVFRNCTITGGGIGINNTTLPCTIAYCVFDSQGSDAVKTSSQLYMTNCSVYNPTGNGVNISTISSSGAIITNCYFDSCSQAGKAGINNTSGANGDLIKCIANAFFNCTANISNVTESLFFFDNGTLASSAFQTPGSQDFSIKVIGQAIGNPSGFETVSLYKGYEDVGACQHLATGGPTGQILRVVGQHFMAG
jgi:hypothetical protein